MSSEMILEHAGQAVFVLAMIGMLWMGFGSDAKGGRE